LFRPLLNRFIVNPFLSLHTLVLLTRSIFKTLLTFRTPRFGRESREAITKVLGRPPVDEAAVAEAIAVA
jgi:hypothetical protein